MAATTLLQRATMSVIDYRCDAHLHAAPVAERHDGYSVSYVRKGSFGYRARGEAFELVAGSVLVPPHSEFDRFSLGQERTPIIAPRPIERVKITVQRY
jgi:AraC family transcriptional regulator